LKSHFYSKGKTSPAIYSAENENSFSLGMFADRPMFGAEWLYNNIRNSSYEAYNAQFDFESVIC